MNPTVARAPAGLAPDLPESPWPRSVADMTAYWNEWNRGTYTSTRSARARSNLAELRPHMFAAAQVSDHGDELLSSFDGLVRQLSIGTHG
jgi:glutamine synthetase adenylyltransferase